MVNEQENYCIFDLLDGALDTGRLRGGSSAANVTLETNTTGTRSVTAAAATVSQGAAASSVAEALADNSQAHEATAAGDAIQAQTDVTIGGGSSTGSAEDGLYEGGTYSPGSQLGSLTLSGTVTRLGGRSRY